MWKKILIPIRVTIMNQGNVYNCIRMTLIKIAGKTLEGVHRFPRWLDVEIDMWGSMFIR